MKQAMLSLAPDAEGTEIDRLLCGIQARYGYDFTHYSRASLKRRIDRVRAHARLPSYAALLERLERDASAFEDFLRTMSITVTEIFRDPPFYRAVREQLVPVFKTFPFIKIWLAGCATGEEAYSMAILLQEEGFLERAHIYATDFNKQALGKAQEGVYSARAIDDAAAHYLAAGGRGSFSAFYSANYDFIKFKDGLKQHITFSYHNLVTDGVFGEMNLICCRNVLIYFDRVLQDRVLGKLDESLRYGGFLCLGNKETLNFTAVKALYEPVSGKQRIFKKRLQAA